MWRVWVRRRGCIGSWWRKPEGKRPLERPWHEDMKSVIPDFFCEVYEICALLGCYAARGEFSDSIDKSEFMANIRLLPHHHVFSRKTGSNLEVPVKGTVLKREDVDQIYLDQNVAHWRAAAYTVMNSLAKLATKKFILKH